MRIHRHPQEPTFVAYRPITPERTIRQELDAAIALLTKLAERLREDER